MSAGGGVFTTQNKVLPGAYINFVSKARALGAVGERGIVAMPFSGSWGKEGEVISLTAEDFQKDCLNILGYSYTDDKMLPLREVFKGASEVKLYRLGTGTKATAEIGTSDKLTVTAVCGGVRGNDIKIVIENDIDSENKFIVKTLVDLVEVDSQTVSNGSELTSNAFVEFKGTNITATAGTSLTGGTDAETKGNDYSSFLDKIEAEDFTTILYAGDDEVSKGLFVSFIKRLRDDEGYKVTCVLHDYSKADFEGVISVKNECSAVENIVDKTGLVYWVAGKTAGAEVNESLTNATYDGELSILASYKKSELKEFIEKGQFAFYGEKGAYKALKDINSFVSITSSKNIDFTNNQVIRVLDTVANDTARIFDQYYLGKVQNNALGRDIFKSELINYHNQLEEIQAIENFTSDDITVQKGTEKGDVVVNEYIEPVGAMEKLYMTCVVE